MAAGAQAPPEVPAAPAAPPRAVPPLPPLLDGAPELPPLPPEVAEFPLPPLFPLEAPGLSDEFEAPCPHATSAPQTVTQPAMKETAVSRMTTCLRATLAFLVLNNSTLSRIEITFARRASSGP